MRQITAPQTETDKRQRIRGKQMRISACWVRKYNTTKSSQRRKPEDDIKQNRKNQEDSLNERQKTDACKEEKTKRTLKKRSLSWMSQSLKSIFMCHVGCRRGWCIMTNSNKKEAGKKERAGVILFLNDHFTPQLNSYTS